MDYRTTYYGAMTSDKDGIWYTALTHLTNHLQLVNFAHITHGVTDAVRMH